MENSEFRTTLRKQKSNIFLTSIHRQKHTSPSIQQYEDIADKYKNYLAALNQKIDSVCEKEQYRTYLKKQKLNSVKNKLQESKQQLQKVLEDKYDPIKSPNGKIYAEILELQKLEASYNDILQKLTNNVHQKKREIEELVQKVKEQKRDIKNTLKESFCESLSNSTVNISKNTKQVPNKSSFSKGDSSSCKSKSRESMLLRLESFWEEKTKETINKQEQKIIMLRLFCVYAKSQETSTHSIPSSSVELIERQLKTREEVLFEVKQIMNKQGKKITSL